MSASNTWDEPFLPWVESANDRRFKKILTILLLIFGIISAGVPFLPSPEPVKKDIKSIPPHLAKLIMQQRKLPPPPAPKLKPKKKVKKKIVKKAKPTKKQKKKKAQTIEKAASSGLLAMSNELEDLRESFNFEAFDDTPLKKSDSIGKQVFDKKVLTSNATKNSGGIKTSKLTKSTGGSKLTSRSTTRVKSALGKTTAKRAVTNSRGQVVRAEEEIEKVFQKNKGAIFSIYNRALRKDPSLQGKVILELTIAPNGIVKKCRIISSELNNKKLEKKIISRVKLFKFKASGAQQVIIKYPIDFLPS